MQATELRDVLGLEQAAIMTSLCIVLAVVWLFYSHKSAKMITCLVLSLCGSMCLYHHVDPFGPDGDIDNVPGRGSLSQRTMLMLRCVILPAVCLSIALQPCSSSGGRIDLGTALSTSMTSLWPRTVYRHNFWDNIWSWIPLVLMNFCRCVLGLTDAAERGKFGVDPWADCWRLWQHVTGVVSIVVGYRFFHGEPGEGRWRNLRNPYGVPPTELVPHFWCLLPISMYLMERCMDALRDSETVRLPFVVGFSGQVVRSLFDIRELVFYLVWPCCAWCLLLPGLPFQEIFRKMLQAVWAYLVLCCSHRLSELVLCFVICVECNLLEKEVIDWGTKRILAEQTVKLPRGTADEIGWEFSKELVVMAVRADGAAERAGVTRGLRLLRIGSSIVCTPAEVDKLTARARLEDNVSPSMRTDTVRATLSGETLPRGSDRSFHALRQAVATKAGRLCLLVHYVFFDMCMYFLTDFSQTVEFSHLALRHGPHCIVVLLTLREISRFNVSTKRLRKMLCEVAIRDDVDHDTREHLRAWHDLLAVSAKRMCVHICGCTVDKRFLFLQLASGFSYVGLGPTLLEFIGLGVLARRRGR